jgi:hypothetical protein
VHGLQGGRIGFDMPGFYVVHVLSNLRGYIYTVDALNQLQLGPDSRRRGHTAAPPPPTKESGPVGGQLQGTVQKQRLWTTHAASHGMHTGQRILESSCQHQKLSTQCSYNLQ